MLRTSAGNNGVANGLCYHNGMVDTFCVDSKALESVVKHVWLHKKDVETSQTSEGECAWECAWGGGVR